MLIRKKSHKLFPIKNKANCLLTLSLLYDTKLVSYKNKIKCLEVHQLKGHELEPILGDSGGWGSLACCTPWDHKELDTT